MPDGWGDGLKVCHLIGRTLPDIAAVPRDPDGARSAGMDRYGRNEFLRSAADNDLPATTIYLIPHVV
jgi:hypothetical protein